MPTTITLPSKYIEDASGNKFAPITTPNAVRWGDGTNLNDHLGGVQADWNEADSTDPSYILNKPTIPAAQVNSDWNAASGAAQILNKPSALPANGGNAATVNNHTVLSDVPANAVFTDTTYSVMGASGSSHASGLVPDPGSTAGTTKFLREDGTWQVPAGGSSSSGMEIVDLGPQTTSDTPVTEVLCEVGKCYTDFTGMCGLYTLPAINAETTPTTKSVVIQKIMGKGGFSIVANSSTAHPYPYINLQPGFEFKNGYLYEFNCLFTSAKRVFESPGGSKTIHQLDMWDVSIKEMTPAKLPMNLSYQANSKLNMTSYPLLPAPVPGTIYTISFDAPVIEHGYEEGYGTLIFYGDVTTIGTYAFYQCPITHIDLPSSVTTIEDGAFCGCDQYLDQSSIAAITALNVNAFIDHNA